MALFEGEHSRKIPVDEINKSWENKRGDLSQEESRDWFIKFLACNPYFAANMLIGPTSGTIHPIQDIIIRTWFQRKRNMLIAGRGFSKSYTTALFVVLYALMNPGSKIGIFSASFRQAKLLFETIEKFVDSPDATYLKQCVDRNKIKHSTDAYEMKIGTSSVKALPLTHKTRGLRMNLVIIDEYLSVPEKIVKEIIGPMLAVKRGDSKEYDKIREGEDILIKEGKLQEWQRTKVPENKTIMLSSASYEFEALYKDVYLQMLNEIHDEKAQNVDSSVMRLSWECAPDILDKSEILAQKSRMSVSQFEREFGAVFTKESGGFYNIKNIREATVEVGFDPKVKLRGDSDKNYIVAIDPNFSAGSEDADDFSISVLELSDDEHERAFLVHSYAIAKSEIQKRTKYLEYILKNFNVVFIIADNAGGPRFIEEFRALHPDYPIKLAEYGVDFETDETFAATRYAYNSKAGTMVHFQIFNKRGWIRDANETLQADIQHKRLMFGSRIGFDDAEIEKNMRLNLDVDLNELEFKYMDEKILGEARKREFIEFVDDRVENTKLELTMIEVTSDAVGNMRFDLPRAMRQTVAKNKARRDSYTSLLLGNWGRKLYYRLKQNQTYNSDVFVGCWVEQDNY